MVCPEDKEFYQACGHTAPRMTEPTEADGLCGAFVCDLKEENKAVRSDSQIMLNKICDGKNDCVNTNLDEINCGFSCKSQNPREQHIAASKNCDKKCDCANCADEASCGQHTKGLFCADGKYIEPDKICDSNDDCMDWKDERYCFEAKCNITLYHNGITAGHSEAKQPVTQIRRLKMDDNCDGIPRCDDSSDEVCVTRTCQRVINESYTLTGTLKDTNICSAPISGSFYRICDDARDQINCTDPTDVALQCKIDGKPSTVSRYVICKGLDMCDDKMDNDCMQISEECLIHKHQFCDGIHDCEGGADEKEELCHVTKSALCLRRYPADDSERKPVPLTWIGDGVVDCKDGVDEHFLEWRFCGDSKFPWATSFTEAETPCEEFYLCANKTEEMVQFPFLYDNVNSCGRENKVCKATSHQLITTNLQDLKSGIRASHFCLPGLNSLQNLASSCVLKQFIHPHKPFGVTAHLPIMVPEEELQCSYLFGAPYVFSSCLGLCSDENIPCPLGKLESDSCVSAYQQKKRVFTYGGDLS